MRLIRILQTKNGFNRASVFAGILIMFIMLLGTVNPKIREWRTQFHHLEQPLAVETSAQIFNTEESTSQAYAQLERYIDTAYDLPVQINDSCGFPISHILREAVHTEAIDGLDHICVQCRHLRGSWIGYPAGSPIGVWMSPYQNGESLFPCAHYYVISRPTFSPSNGFRQAGISRIVRGEPDKETLRRNGWYINTYSSSHIWAKQYLLVTAIGAKKHLTKQREANLNAARPLIWLDDYFASSLPAEIFVSLCLAAFLYIALVQNSFRRKLTVLLQRNDCTDLSSGYVDQQAKQYAFAYIQKGLTDSLSQEILNRANRHLKKKRQKERQLEKLLEKRGMQEAAKRIERAVAMPREKKHRPSTASARLRAIEEEVGVNNLPTEVGRLLESDIFEALPNKKEDTPLNASPSEEQIPQGYPSSRERKKWIQKIHACSHDLGGLTYLKDTDLAFLAKHLRQLKRGIRRETWSAFLEEFDTEEPDTWKPYLELSRAGNFTAVENAFTGQEPAQAKPEAEEISASDLLAGQSVVIVGGLQRLGRVYAELTQSLGPANVQYRHWSEVQRLKDLKPDVVIYLYRHSSHKAFNMSRNLGGKLVLARNYQRSSYLRGLVKDLNEQL